MLNPDFTPMPVYAAMKDYIAQARAVTPGFRSTSDWAMDWHGAWETRPDYRAYFGEYKIGKPGDSVNFVFRGTDLDLVALQNPYGGAVSVQVDDQPAREMDLWLTDPEVGGRIALARDLDDGEHRAVITVTRSPVAINGFILQRGSTWWMKRVGVIVLALGLVVAVAVWRRARGMIPSTGSRHWSAQSILRRTRAVVKDEGVAARQRPGDCRGRRDSVRAEW